MKRNLFSSVCNHSFKNQNKYFIRFLYSMFVIILSHWQLMAQNISVNSTGALPDPSAMLDVVSPNKGLLIPRVILTGINDNTTIPNPATSLLVYNTNSSMVGGGVGFWYWNGTQWTRFSGAFGTTGNTGATGPTGSKGITGATGTDGSKNAWGFLGSTGTVDGTHFIGTIDNVPLNIRVSNQHAGRIDQNLSNAYWGYQTGNVNGTGSENTAMGSYAFSSNTTGGANAVLGNYALNANTTGVRNTAIGFSSLSANTQGDENTALGMFTLASNTNGTRNTASGNEALAGNTTGVSNTAMGYYALHDNSAGSNNTAIGYGAGYTITGSNNTFIGYFATPAGSSALTNATAIGSGAQVSASNCMVLGAGVNVGIGLSAPTHRLDVNGSFNVNGVTTCTSGAWSSSDQQFKTNIDSIANALAIISQLQPHSFNFDVSNGYGLNFPSERQYGLVAQEVMTILPELVGTTTKGVVYDTAGVMITPAVTYKTLNYNAFIAILMKGMQEQQQRLDTQTTTINTLQNQVNTLIQQVQELQNH